MLFRNNPKPTHQAQTGMALLVTVLVITLVTGLISLGLLARQRQTARRIGSYLNNQFSFYSSYAKSMDNVRRKLADETIDNNYDYLNRAQINSEETTSGNVVQITAQSSIPNTSQRATEASLHRDPVYIVVLFDVSSSMFKQSYDTEGCTATNGVLVPGCPSCLSDPAVPCEPLATARNGLRDFLNTFNDLDYINIRVIPYNVVSHTNTYISQPEFADFKTPNTSNINDIMSAIEQLKPQEFTNLHYALEISDTTLSSPPLPSPARKYVVVLSDGQPTAMNNADGTECYSKPHPAYPPTGNQCLSETQIRSATFTQANSLKDKFASDPDNYPIIIYGIKYGQLADQILRNEPPTQPGIVTQYNILSPDPGAKPGRVYYYEASDPNFNIQDAFRILAAQLLQVIEIDPTIP